MQPQSSSGHIENGHNPIVIDDELCIRCPLCDIVCPGDIIIRGQVNKVDLPTVRYPAECWYCGLCEQSCPTGAITIVFPDNMLRPKVSFTDLIAHQHGAGTVKAQ